MPDLDRLDRVFEAFPDSADEGRGRRRGLFGRRARGEDAVWGDEPDAADSGPARGRGRAAGAAGTTTRARATGAVRLSQASSRVATGLRGAGAVRLSQATCRVATGLRGAGAVRLSQATCRVATGPRGAGAVRLSQPGTRAPADRPGAVPPGQPGTRAGRLTRSGVHRHGAAGDTKARRPDRRPGPEVPGHNQVTQAQPPARANRGPRWASRAQPARRARRGGRSPPGDAVGWGRPRLTRARWPRRAVTRDARRHPTILDAVTRGRPRRTRARSPRRAATWAGPGLRGGWHRQLISVVVHRTAI